MALFALSLVDDISGRCPALNNRNKVRKNPINETEDLRSFFLIG